MKTSFALATFSALALSVLVAPAALADASKVTSCLGTEPFWNLTIDSKKVTFEDFGSESKRTIDNKGARPAFGHTTAYVTLYQGKVKEEPGRFMNVMIRAEECSDGMSDETYPFSVLVLSGTDLHVGCCRASK